MQAKNQGCTYELSVHETPRTTQVSDATISRFNEDWKTYAPGYVGANSTGGYGAATFRPCALGLYSEPAHSLRFAGMVCVRANGTPSMMRFPDNML